jgi:hypothetical protein
VERYIFWTFILAVLAALSVAVAAFVRAYRNGSAGSALFFKPRGDRRLEVIEHANVDGRRKLVLIRRDNVEHLVMIGGPVDVVVETGISYQPEQVEHAAPPPPIGPRLARFFGRQKEMPIHDATTREL